MISCLTNKVYIEDKSYSLSKEEQMELATAAAKGDQAALKQIVLIIYDRVRKVVSYTVRDRDWAEDLVSASILKILESLEKFRAESSLEFWSTRIALNMSIKAIKTKQRRNELLALLPQLDSNFEEPDKKTESKKLRDNLYKILSRLPEKQLMTISLKYLHDYNIKEISHIMKVPENTVRDRLNSGKRKMKKLLEKNPEIKNAISLVKV